MMATVAASARGGSSVAVARRSGVGAVCARRGMPVPVAIAVAGAVAASGRFHRRRFIPAVPPLVMCPARLVLVVRRFCASSRASERDVSVRIVVHLEVVFGLRIVVRVAVAVAVDVGVGVVAVGLVRSIHRRAFATWEAPGLREVRRRRRRGGASVAAVDRVVVVAVMIVPASVAVSRCPGTAALSVAAASISF